MAQELVVNGHRFTDVSLTKPFVYPKCGAIHGQVKLIDFHFRCECGSVWKFQPEVKDK